MFKNVKYHGTTDNTLDYKYIRLSKYSSYRKYLVLYIEIFMFIIECMYLRSWLWVWLFAKGM